MYPKYCVCNVCSHVCYAGVQGLKEHPGGENRRGENPPEQHGGTHRSPPEGGDLSDKEVRLRGCLWRGELQPVT